MVNTVFRKRPVDTSGAAWQPENQALGQKSVTVKECRVQTGSTHHESIWHARQAVCLSRAALLCISTLQEVVGVNRPYPLFGDLWHGNTNVPLLPNETHRGAEGAGWKLHSILTWAGFRFMWLKRIIRVLVCYKHHRKNSRCIALAPRVKVNRSNVEAQNKRDYSRSHRDFYKTVTWFDVSHQE